MNYDSLRTSVKTIEMTEAMKKRVVSETETASKRAVSRRSARKKIFVSALAVVMCLAVSIPVLAATVESVYQLMYLVSPAAAQYFQPVRKSDEDNGISLEVVSAYMLGDTAKIYVALRDLTGDRVDGTTDLYDSYSIRRPFDSSAHCEFAGYDENMHTATFLITVTRMDGRDIAGGNITFSLKQFLSKKKEYIDVEIPVDMSGVSTASETQSVRITGGSGVNYVPDTFRAIPSGAPCETFPVDGVDLTGMAFVDGKLHIQSAVKNRSSNDNHGYFYLEDAAGNRVNCDEAYYFLEEDSGERVDYAEYVFSVSSEELGNYRLFGNFTVSGMSTQGDWRITFSLKPEA